MKAETLFEVIGELDDDMIAETEKQSGTKGKRIGIRVMLVAAILAGLGLTAGAAPLIRNALKNGTLVSNHQAVFTPTDPDSGNSYEVRSHDIRVEIALDQTAPEYIEAFYIPEIPEGYEQFLGALYNQGSLFHCVWKTAEDYAHNIAYWQTSRYSYDPDEIVAVITTAPGDQPITEMRTYGNIEGYYAQQNPVAELPGKKLFFWSDGSYLYRLELPYQYTDTQIADIIASVAPVSDINTYLMSAEDAAE